MIELSAVILVFYALSVLASWGMIKLIFEDIPSKYALIPVLNVILPFLVAGRGPASRRTAPRPARTPIQELDRERNRHGNGAPPWVR